MNTALFHTNKTGKITHNKVSVEVVRAGYSIPGASFNRTEFDNELTYNNPKYASGYIFIVRENGKYSGKVLNLEKSLPNANFYDRITPAKAEKILKSYTVI